MASGGDDDVQKGLEDGGKQQERLRQQQAMVSELYSLMKSDKEEFMLHDSHIESNSMSTGEAQQRFDDLQRLQKSVLNAARDMKKCDLSEQQKTQLQTFMKTFHAASFLTIGKYRELISLRNPTATNTETPLLNTSESDSTQRIKVKLPDFKLPDFDGSLDKWLTWRDTYDSLIHRNESLSKVVKYHYLRAAMKFPAGQQNVLNNFPLNENSYEEAWKALCARYDDKRKLKSQFFNSLLTVKRMTSDSSSEVRRILDSFSSTITSLDLLESTYDDLLVHIVQFRLDDQTSKEWQKFIGKEEVSFEKMKTFLTEYWRTLDSVPSQSKRQQQLKSTDLKPTSSKTFSSSSSSQSSGCPVCKEAHLLFMCPKFRTLNVSERYNVVNDNHLCRNCFSPQHVQRNCTSLNRCKWCKQNHHSMLHSERTSNSAGANEAQQVRAQQTYQPNLNPQVKPFQPVPPPRVNYPPRTNLSTFDGHSNESKSFTTHVEALLSTVIVLVLDKKNKWIEARALMDSGSQSNYMTTEFAQMLETELIPTCQPVIGINGQTSVIRHRTKAVFCSKYREFSGELGCCVSDDITGFLPNRTINMKNVSIPSGLFLADPEFFKSGRIDMLLGTGIYHDSQLGNVIKQANMPVLMETEFGWTVGGNFPSSDSSSSLLCCFTQFPDSGFQELDAKLEKFLEIENYGSVRKILSPEESYCKDLYDKTTYQDKSGRYIVQLPFKANFEQLGTNYANATRQFFYQEKKRLDDEELNRLYIDYMTEFITSGHMTEVNSSEKNEGTFLPHHGVKRVSSKTTKLRPVFNASSKTETGITLNECLCVGPSVQPESFDILLRFREKQFVLKSDIEKMYRQIFIDPSQRKYQKVLWRSSPSEPISHYTLNTVTFGLAPSPYLATETLNRIAESFTERFPEAAKIVKTSFYVDDLLFSFDSIEEGLRLRNQIRYMLLSSLFPARKWSSNHPDLVKDMLVSDVESLDEESPAIKALGVVWNPKADEISFAMKSLGESPTTKAELLSEIAGIYDPIGFIGPVILLAKLHMKPLRLLKWNQQLEDEDKNHWENFRSKLVALNDVTISRHAIAVNPISIQLHGFGDASEEAYGAVIYIRSCDTFGNTQISLICSKSRVSPSKQKSIARLELCAATLLSKLVSRIIEILTVSFSDVILWSDSMIVLYWIATEPSKLSVFIGNRVSIIHEHTESFTWRHVRGENNPADLISRGLMPDEIKDCSMWWNGPLFLSKPPAEWPESLLTLNDDDPEVGKELRKTFVAAKDTQLFTLIETRFSSLQKVTNCFAYIRRFTTKGRTFDETLSIDELEQATFTIVKVLQRTLFPLEFDFFTQQRQNPQLKLEFPSKSSLISLSPFMDENGVIRVGGRIEASPGLTLNQRHQIVIPKSHFAKLIVRDIHKRFLHPGQLATLSHVREQFWPIDAKSVIRQVQHECIICFRAKPKFPTQIMGSLPSARVTMTQPFLSTAVDYAGPFNLRTSLTKKSSMTKAYVAMFKCMATGAIHLEAVTSLSTAAFIMTFDRFVSRRGLSRDIFSDNGTEFVGANNEFKRILSETAPLLKEHLKEKGIKWHFTTPLAPHAGGYYESGIKSMKHHLVRESANRSFDFEQFTSLLCKIEAIINSRPLTPMSDDVNDLEALTPAHFLIGRSLIAKPERNFLPVNTNRLDRYNQLQQLQQKLWDRWYHEYLHHLQTRPVHFRKEHEFHVGDLVLVKDTNLPPLKWLMGRIIKTFPDRKGIVRNVAIKTPTGEKQRNVKYLCFLPIEMSSNQPAGGECSLNET